MTGPTAGPPAEDRVLVLHREYPDPIDDVWAALTESDRLARWIGSYTGTGGAAGTVEFTMTGEVDAGGTVAAPATVAIVACEPPGPRPGGRAGDGPDPRADGPTARLVVDIPETAHRAWRVAVQLTGTARGTSLRFEQRITAGIDPADVEAGWSWYLDRLGAALHDAPMPAWDDYLPAR